MGIILKSPKQKCTKNAISFSVLTVILCFINFHKLLIDQSFGLYSTPWTDSHWVLSTGTK